METSETDMRQRGTLKPRESGTQHSNYPTRQLKFLILTSDARLPCAALPKTLTRILQNLQIES
jgi:hypothetical protein